MLLSVIIALIILSTSLLLHYFQHFKILCCKRKSQRRKSHDTISTGSRLSITGELNKYDCFTMVTRDDEEFDFFPAAFFYYLTFQILLCLLIITLDIITYSNTYNKLHSDLLFTYTIPTLHHINNVKNSLFTYHHKVQVSNFNQVNEYQLIINISEYILCYSVMLLLLWESLFSFYKYYTTLFVVLHCKIASTKAVTMRFMIYVIIFSICFNLQIHFYYYLWPILLALHFIFNTYCTFKFSSILITKYIAFIDVDDRFENEENINILNSVYFMRRTSMICCILQTIYFGLFIISYSANTIYYLPIIWSICGGVYTINFVRNRRYILFKIFECKYKKFVKTNNTKNVLKKPNVEDKIFIQSNSVINISTNTDINLSNTDINISTNTDEITCNSGAINTCTISSTVSGEHYTYAMTDNLPISAPKIGAYKLQSIPTPIMNNKALKILGITPSTSQSVSKIKPKTICKPLMVQSHSDMRIRSMSISEENHYISKMKLSVQKKEIKVSQSDITNNNIKKHVIVKIENDIQIDKKEENNTIDVVYTPKLPLRRLSSPSVPNRKISVNVDDIDYIDEDDSAENDDDEIDDEFECVYIDYKSENITNIDSIIHNELFGNHKYVDSIPIPPISPASPTPIPIPSISPKLRHQRSNSAPGDVGKSMTNLNEVIESLDLFAKYGFCSRNSVNSLYQLTKYQYKINKTSK